MPLNKFSTHAHLPPLRGCPPESRDQQQWKGRRSFLTRYVFFFSTGVAAGAVTPNQRPILWFTIIMGQRDAGSRDIVVGKTVREHTERRP